MLSLEGLSEEIASLLKSITFPDASQVSLRVPRQSQEIDCFYLRDKAGLFLGYTGRSLQSHVPRQSFMDFDQLETFLEVARLSSFSRAAEKRFRTQPAISSQIRSLEEEIGAKLLDRSGGKVSITASGKLFQKFAEETH